MTNVITIENASKRFGQRNVLNNVTLNVPSGVVFGLLGENGAGKSTLIRSLLGYHRLDAGSIRVCGFDPMMQPLQLRRTVGYVADTPGLYEWMTVAEAGWYASGFYPAGFLDRFNHLLHQFDLPAASKIRELSKGMRAKVALSLAIAFDPPLLILDEPTSGLDPMVRRSFLESMIDRAASGQTVFLSSHQIHEVERIADWIAILHAGELRVVAPLEELKSSIQLLSFSLRDPLIAPPEVMQQLETIHRSQVGRAIKILVRGLNDQIMETLVKDANLIDVQAIRPNLEELYLGFCSDPIHDGGFLENSRSTARRDRPGLAVG
jgi:ABC-2 type transport system ATP-binding protein